MSAAIHTGWPAVIDYSQCDATRHITMLIHPALVIAMWSAVGEGGREREGGKETIKKVWDGEREREQMNGCVSVWSHCVSVHACLSHWEACNTKAAATLVFSALTTLLVIGMTFENILTEDKRLNSEWVDLSPAKLQLEGWGRNNANRSPQNM